MNNFLFASLKDGALNQQLENFASEIGRTFYQGAPIDLLFDRQDDAITICEIKYSEKPFVITKEYSQKLKQKLEIFKKVTKTTKQLFIVFITSNGLKKNKYSEELVSAVVTLDDIFI